MDEFTTFPLKYHLFQEYIIPILNEKQVDNISDSYRQFLIEMSMFAWTWGFNKKEFHSNILLFHDVLDSIKNVDEEQLVNLFKATSELTETSRELINLSLDFYKRALKSKNTLEILKTGMGLYKDLYESELRIWSSFIYLYTQKVAKLKEARNIKASELVNFPSGSKIYVINQLNITLKRGNPKIFIKGFENKYRNSGEGHLRYEVTDDETAILKFINRDGKEVGKEELSKIALDKLIKQCKKSLLLMEIGALTYLINNPAIHKKLINQPAKNLRILEELTKQFANTRSLTITDFKFNKSKGTLSLTFKPPKKPVGTSGELLTSEGKKYYILRARFKREYTRQVLGVIQYVLSMTSLIPDIVVKIMNVNNNTIADIKFTSEEMKKLKEKGKKHFPIPKSGTFPKEFYYSYRDFPVEALIPREVIIRGLIAQGFTIVD